MRTTLPALFLSTLVVMSQSACRTTETARLADDGSSATLEGPALCAAVRGNGQYLFAHFGSLARIVEEVGVPDGMSGGSSGSITTFLYESMRLNRSVKVAGVVDREALALLLKSMMGYLEVLKDSEEVRALKSLVELAATAQQNGAGANSTLGTTQSAIAIQQTLSDSALRSLINPTIFAMLLDQDDLGYVNYDYKVREIRTALASLGKFDASDEKILFREGIINYPGLVEAIGRIGDFYAERGPADPETFDTFIKGCKATRSATWQEIAATRLASGETCGAVFSKLLKDYRAAATRDPSFAGHRLDDAMGTEILSIATSAHIQGTASVVAFDEATTRYRQGQEPRFALDFDTVKIGYWMPAGLQPTVETKLLAAASTDAKAKHAHIFSRGATPSWRAALEKSTMEPGLSRLLRDSNTSIHAGGWSDLHPVQVLQAAGCGDVIYVTRRGEETGFVSEPRPITDSTSPHGVAELLGLKADYQKALYTWSNLQSSYSRAIDGAGAVWCTEWDLAGSSEFDKMFALGYGAKFVPNSPNLTDKYPSGQLVGSLVGCRR